MSSPARARSTSAPVTFSRRPCGSSSSDQGVTKSSDLIHPGNVKIPRTAPRRPGSARASRHRPPRPTPTSSRRKGVLARASLGRGACPIEPLLHVDQSRSSPHPITAPGSSGNADQSRSGDPPTAPLPLVDAQPPTATRRTHSDPTPNPSSKPPSRPLLMRTVQRRSRKLGRDPMDRWQVSGEARGVGRAPLRWPCWSRREEARRLACAPCRFSAGALGSERAWAREVCGAELARKARLWWAFGLACVLVGCCKLC